MRDEGVYDYVVVGGGSAGCVLAARLTECGRHRVLLLEAGGEDRNPWIHIPLGYGRLFAHPRLNWNYLTEPEPELNGRRIGQPRGRVLGGSSSINGLIYIRGQREDFDGWAELGVPGWSYDEVLPWFRRSVRQMRGEDPWHAGDGPLAVSDQSEPHPLCDAFIAAAAADGHVRNPDFNGAAQTGVGYYQTTSLRGRRVSTAVAYLKPARRRPNLRVVTGATVDRVELAGRTARSVDWRAGGVPCRARARGEVILCAGALASPALLERSGVGRADRVAALGIEPVVHSPGVGENLQDHLQVRTVFQAVRPITINDDLASPWRSVGMGARYLLRRRGPLTVSAGYAGAFLSTRPPDTRPDMQLLLITFSTDKMGTRLDPFSGFTISCSQLRPTSRGSVHAASADPAAPPAIRANYLSTEEDRAAAVRGMRLVRRIAAQPPLAGEIAAEVAPGANASSDEALLAHARATAGSLYHPACAVAMGGPDAPLDPRFRVRGASGLRVVDGSAMPALVSGNTNAAIVMMAERASAMILDDARTTPKEDR